MPFNLSESQLQQTEKLLGAKFPASYRQAMMRSNGGEVDIAGEEWELIPIRDDSSERRLSRTDEDVVSWTDQFRMWKSWPDLAIAIARNGVGDALVLRQEGARIQPEVYAWRHENGALETVANDFGDLKPVTTFRSGRNG